MLDKSITELPIKTIFSEDFESNYALLLTEDDRFGVFSRTKWNFIGQYFHVGNLDL